MAGNVSAFILDASAAGDDVFHDNEFLARFDFKAAAEGDLSSLGRPTSSL